jgi:esterase/lipase superfamily enzyme
MYQHSDKFYAAVRALSGNGPIKKRLTSAYDDNLAHLPVEELPENIRPRFEKLRRTMLAVKPLGTESPVLATVRKMSKVDANRCANQIVAMFSELERGKGSSKRLDQPSTGAQSDNLATGRYRLLN